MIAISSKDRAAAKMDLGFADGSQYAGVRSRMGANGFGNRFKKVRKTDG